MFDEFQASRGCGPRYVHIAALMAALAAVTSMSGCKRFSAPAGTGGGGLSPSWVHRGAVTLFTVGANTSTAPAQNSQLSAASSAGAPGSCSANPTVQLVNQALASFTDPDTGQTVNEQIDCTQSYFVTTVKVLTPSGYDETYFAFETIPVPGGGAGSPAHGHAIYYGASGSKPAGLMFEPD